MRVSSPVFRVSTLYYLAIGPLHAICLDELVLAVVLNARRAHLAIGLQAAFDLSTNTNAIANFDSLFYVLADSDGFADNLMALKRYVNCVSDDVIASNTVLTDDCWVWCLAPSTPQGVKIRSTDSAVRNLNVNIAFLPRLCLIWLPLHLALDRVSIKATPALKLWLCRHIREMYT